MPKGKWDRGSPVDRLNARLAPDPATGCINFTGKLAPSGYGSIRVGAGQMPVGAHRFAYELAKGPIPNGLVIDHLCRNRACCNPDHMEPVSPQINTLRGSAPTAVNAQKTHCKHGHEFTPENIYRPKAGGRQCRACRSARSAAR